MVPKYPFEVEHHYMIGHDKRNRETKAFELLPAAMEYANALKRKPTTKRVTLRATVDDWSPSENGR